MNTVSLRSSAAKKRGISLIEGVLYLVLALGVIVGGIVFFQQAQLGNNVTNTSRAATGIASQIRGIYQNSPNFGAVNQDLTEMVLAAGGVPSNFVDNAGTPGDSTDDRIMTPFEGTMIVESTDGALGTTAAQYFHITLDNLGEAECVRLGTLSPAGDGPLGTNIIGVSVSSGAAIGVDFSVPGAVAAGNAVAWSSLNPNNPEVGIDAAGLTLACEEEGNTIRVIYGR